jgi:lipoprotein-anchoring transpeptidase ErfK/SrfK
MLSRRSALLGFAALLASNSAFAQSSTGAGGKWRPAAKHVRNAPKPYVVNPVFAPQTVAFTGYKPGTIVIDPKAKFLYLVLTPLTARRYGVAVGREGLDFHGEATVHVKTEWPRWIPTADMVKNEPDKYARYKNGMDGGPSNPLGARAMYLWQGSKDTYIRIHGTNDPASIGQAASHGCFRMINEDVIDLFDRVNVGTPVVVL